MISNSKREMIHAKVNQGFIELTDVGHYYEIKLNKIKEPLDICRWVAHLCEKVWVTPELIRQFVIAVCKEKGWHPYGL